MINEFTGNVRNVSSLANKPALTPEELKAVFDKTGIDLKEYINETLVPEINNELSGKVSAINGKRLMSNEEGTKLNGIEEGADNFGNHISIGTTAPTSSTTGEYYLQYFD